MFSLLCLLGAFLQMVAQCTAPASEFQLEGEYLKAGLYDITHRAPVYYDRTEATGCNSLTINMSG